MHEREETWEELLTFQVKKPGSLRVYFGLLQVMYLLIYAFHLPALSLRPAEGWIIVKAVVLIATLLIMLTVPQVTLSTAWFISSVTMTNAMVLFSTLSRDTWTDPGMMCAVMLLLAMVSYVPSIAHFAVVSGLIVIAYGGILVDQLHPDAVLLVPAFLCLTLVFLSKTGLFHAELQRMAPPRPSQVSAHDALTGLPNRAQFLEHLQRIIQYRYVNRNFHFAVLFIDLDGFKPVNDRLGHKAGDVVLRHTAKLLQACVRKGDVVGRYGGDEFTILLNNVKSLADAVRVADILLAKLQTPIMVGEPVKVGASIGIALSTNLHERPEDLIRDADTAMYQAKARGKNCYAVSDQTEVPKAELKARWKRIVQLQWLAREQ